MAKLTLNVNDDGSQTGTGTMDLTSTTTTIGTGSTAPQWAAFRFTGVTVPNAASIRKATLKVNCATISGTTGTSNVKIEDADNSAALSASASNVSSRTFSATTSQVRIHDLPDGYKYFDVTDLVQAIINRAGWVSGNAMLLAINPAWVSAAAVISMSESANPPQLSIIYNDNATSFTTFGSNTGSYLNPTNATAIDATYATLDNTPAGTHTFFNFGFAVPGTDVIDDVVVFAVTNVSSTTAKSRYGMEISTDGGSTWATQKFSNQIDATDTNAYWGGDPDGWGITLTPALINDNTNFRIRIQNDFGASTNDARLDYIAVKVLSHAGSGGGGTTVKQLAALGVG